MRASASTTRPMVAPGCSSSRPGSTSSTTACGRRRSAASSSCSRGWTRPGRTGPSVGSSPGSTRRDARSPTSRSRPTWRSRTTTCGGCTTRCPHAASSGCSTARTTKTSSPPASNGVVDTKQCEQRYHHIREFERMLRDEGTTMVKVFLHISKDEQRRRLQERIDDPEKNWKFHRSDLEVRARWDEYQQVYEEAITATSTDWAPWYVVPADHKSVRDVAVARGAPGGLREPRPPNSRPRAGARRRDRRVIPFSTGLGRRSSATMVTSWTSSRVIPSL